MGAALRSAVLRTAVKSQRPSLRVVKDFPGREVPQGVPFGGQGGPRKLPKARPKLTKLQKRALKWAKKHPEEETAWRVLPRIFGNCTTNAVTFRGTGAGAYETPVGMFTEVLEGYVGQPATQGVLTNIAQDLNNTVTRFQQQHYGGGITLTGGTTLTAGTTTTPTIFMGNAATITLTATTSSTNATWTIPMQDWTAWNTNYTPTDGWLINDKAQDMYAQRRQAHLKEWLGWQGKGHQADLAYNPNDQLLRERQRRDRLLRDEAVYAQQRMQQAEREAEQRRQWEAAAPERERVRVENERLRVENERKLQGAKARSYDLLFRHLTDEQKNMLESENRFLIEVKSGKIYEIQRGIHQNVFRLDDEGRQVEQLCCLPRGNVPEGDVMLAQMLHLMVNEDGFRKVANLWELRDMTGKLDRRRPLTEGARVLDRRVA